MVRGVLAVLLLCASSAIAADPAAAGQGDADEDVSVVDDAPALDQLAVDLAGEIGVLSQSHATVTAGYMRRLWGERLYVEARLGAGASADFVVLEVRGGVGLVFRPGERTELLVGWRVGDTYLNGHLAGDIGFAPLQIHLLAIELAITFQLELDERWRLRALPVVPTVFWNGTYGGALGLELGVGRAF